MTWHLDTLWGRGPDGDHEGIWGLSHDDGGNSSDWKFTRAHPASVPAATGAMHQVKMLGDAQGYRFEPANITVKAGDGIKFVNVSGGPHNAAFDPAEVPADVKGQLSANMPNQMSELSGPLLVNPNEAYTISFANIKPGTYNYHCTPHLAMGMKGVITVQ